MKSKSTALLLMVSIFLLGGIAGAVSHYLYQNHFGPHPAQRPVQGRRDIVDQMAKSLNLDDEQKEKLRDIVKRSAERYDALAKPYRPQYDRIRAETNEEIRAILRPDQRLHLDETLERMDRRGRPRQGQQPPAVSR
jgi:Spy/CpxP family protein refolding chaperone